MSQGSENGAAPLHGAHILVVEDDFVLRLEIETVLRGAGAAAVRTCGTVAVYTGQVASEAVISQWPNVPVVSKPALPVMLISAVSEMLRSSATPHAHDR